MTIPRKRPTAGEIARMAEERSRLDAQAMGRAMATVIRTERRRNGWHFLALWLAVAVVAILAIVA